MNKGDAPVNPSLAKRVADPETPRAPEVQFGEGEPPVHIDLKALGELLRIRDLERKGRSSTSGRGRSSKR